MADIVVVTRFQQAGSNAFSSYIDYVDRSNATRKNNVEKFNMFGKYMEYMDDEAKTVVNEEQKIEKISSLFTTGKDSLFIEEKKDIKEAFRVGQKNGSPMWQTVISFKNEYLQEVGIYDGENNTLNEKELMQAARLSINNMLKNENMENSVWTGAIHYNTDNIHIHIAITQTNPTREKKEFVEYEKDSDGKVKTRVNESGEIEKIPKLDRNGNIKTYETYIGRFKNKSHMIMKSSLKKELEKNSEAYISLNKMLREIIADKNEQDLLENEIFKDMMKNLYGALKQETLKEKPLPLKYWNYNQNSIPHLKPKIDEISDFFIKTYHNAEFKELMVKLENEAKKQEKIYGGKSDYVKNKLHDKSDGLYTRLGNAILKELRRYEKDRISQITDMKEAMKCFEKLKDGNVNPEYNPAKGIELLDDVAKRGNTFAQNKLGSIYLKGEFVERDVEKASEYFRASARNGNSYGVEMVQKIEDGKRKFRKSRGIGICNRDVNRMINQLKKNMNKEYINYVNKSKAAELQQEIEHRGSYEAEL